MIKKKSTFLFRQSKPPDKIVVIFPFRGNKYGVEKIFGGEISITMSYCRVPVFRGSENATF